MHLDMGNLRGQLPCIVMLLKMKYNICLILQKKFIWCPHFRKFLDPSLTPVMDFIFLYMRKQNFMLIYEKGDMNFFLKSPFFQNKIKIEKL